MKTPLNKAYLNWLQRQEYNFIEEPDLSFERFIYETEVNGWEYDINGKIIE